MFRTCVNGLFVAVLVLLGCNRDRPDGRPILAAPREMSLVNRASAAPTVPTNPQIIRTAIARVQVHEVGAAVDSIGALVRLLSGQVRGQAECEDPYGARTSTLTCEVPAEKLDAVVARLRELGRVEALTIRSKEITEESFDLETQLANKKAFETSLVRLLERKTDDLAALVQVEGEIARVRGEIDQLEGRRRLWNHQIALSTLEVDFHRPAPKLAAPESRAILRLRGSFRTAGENFLETLAWLIGAMGVMVPLGFAVFGLGRLLRPVWRMMRRAGHARLPAEGVTHGLRGQAL